ncbi:hypothetical protein K490DRAFT_64234 [Saccharata proteae CBS 121410]|uniref:Cora-domain-containing protein n=1 Tax=Saccharata proteae CBS 121410 TaxID=1314787 RepID=A0A6A5YBX7_9PEZI|nr:hypothetical protein K490DRAFT_64234 [Saccharata proteae CBS 121410]
MEYTEHCLPQVATITDETSAEDFFCESNAENWDMMILSFFQEHSQKPFLVTESLLRRIFGYFDITPIFLDTLLGVQSKTQVSEETYGNSFYQHVGDQFEIAYQLKYVEFSDRGQGSPWTTRRTEIFQRSTRGDNGLENIWLLFHPRKDSVVKERLENQAADSRQWSLIQQSPVRQHISIISTYVDNWRGVLMHYGQLYQNKRKYIATVNFEEESEFKERLNFKTLQELRELEERIMVIPFILKATNALIKSLSSMNRDLRVGQFYNSTEYRVVENALKSINVRLDGYIDSSNVLLDRIKGINKMAADALNLSNQTASVASQKSAVKQQELAAKQQETSTEINKNVLKLTKDNVADNAVVRVVTLVTLLYLPASFIASLFGMNFFDFGDETSKIRVASNWWIYLAVTVPLTIMTAIVWWQASRKQKRKREEQSKQPGV